MHQLIRKPFQIFYCVAFLLFTQSASAQAVLIQNSISKIKSYRSFTYQSIEKRKDFTNDTITYQQTDSFFSAPESKPSGYWYHLQFVSNDNGTPLTKIYDGQQIMSLNDRDSTYEVGPFRRDEMQFSMLGRLNWLKGFLDNNPSKVTRSKDTVINSSLCSHLVVNTKDSVTNHEHYYTRIHVYINQASSIPAAVIIKAKFPIGSGVSNYIIPNYAILILKLI